MTVHETAPQPIRVDFVPHGPYISPQFLQLENERMWPKVWQVACRLEEIPHVGDYVTFDVIGESIIVTRLTGDKIKAYYNVCQHRGRRLTSGCGHATKFHCAFHGWQWNLDGSLLRILDEEDWAGCPSMAKEDLALKEVLVDTWGGFVFINMDPQAEPLAKYLAPVPEFTDCFEFEKMRYRWYKSIRLPCNWKVALEAFNEGYHVAATHPQILDTQGDDVTRSFAFGKHGMFG
ncbi:aromatic ring-hydroxylating dioxygenase subunit alpha [Pseudomonas sp. CG7]|uniref:aromatic ring-hydroxylating oxygenase subunit alpha n=1 Tax=Pseudomonas sp. CG7 TaxID=191007 RepID=UPI00203330C1|nr:aromatic ring-hydroxylating dioxygenase subunit alpha [Pseudomonas sp. CG7]